MHLHHKCHRWLRCSSPRGPHAPLEPVSSGTSPSLFLHGMLKDPSRMDRLAGLPPAWPARWISFSQLLRPGELQHIPCSWNISYWKSKFTTNLYRAFQMTCNWQENVMRNTKLYHENCYASFHRKPCNSKIPSDTSKKSAFPISQRNFG